jgi:hypothetical protein
MKEEKIDLDVKEDVRTLGTESVRKQPGFLSNLTVSLVFPTLQLAKDLKLTRLNFPKGFERNSAKLHAARLDSYFQDWKAH